jgi:o-succinylbenzoate---CoA ligase
LRPRTIRPLDEWLTSAARARPDHPALVAEGRSVAYAELERAAARAARRLAAQGVEEGDRVATTLGPGLAFAELLHAVPRLGAVLVPLDPRAPARVDPRLLVQEPLQGQEADVPLRESVDPHATHSVIHTSGSMGRPKPVELSYENHAASAAASAANLGVQADDRWLCPLPLHHVGGLAVLLRSAIYATTAVVHERFEAERIKRQLERGEATLASLVPTMLVRLRELGLGRPERLRAILLGGGPAPSALVDWAERSGLPVLLTYGMTETASQVATAVPGERAGRPLQDVELRIGAGGEILVRGPMVAAGALSEDGWLHTGDRGRLDESGRLHVEGRLKNVIVTGGENVAAEEVEEALLEHPGVADAAVVGLPDPEWGEAVTALVVLRPETTADELLDWCRQRLAPAQVPKRLEQVPCLPRSGAGKLLRDELLPPSAASRPPGSRRRGSS